jgi:hypothetical protein
MWQNSILGSDKNWIQFCKSFRKNSGGEDFRAFRSHPTMLWGVEGTNYISSFDNIFFFRNNPQHIVTKLLKKISLSDTFGAPINVFSFYVNNEIVTINPTTLRYAKNWANIFDLFNLNSNSSKLSISEIGGGYGGEAKVFFDLRHKLNNKKFISYEIYDLKSSTQLIAKFLKVFGYSVKFKYLNDSKYYKIKADSKKLVISNAALSEMWGDLLNSYLKEVVYKADYGYFIVNFDTHSKPYGGISNQDFFDLLKKNGKKPIWLDTDNFLTSFDKDISKLIIFGAEISRVNFANKIRKKPRFLYQNFSKIVQLSSQSTPSTKALLFWLNINFMITYLCIAVFSRFIALKKYFLFTKSG